MYTTALSRVPLQRTTGVDTEVQSEVVAAVELAQPEKELATKRQDIALTQSQYALTDKVLYHLESDGIPRVIPPGRNSLTMPTLVLTSDMLSCSVSYTAITGGQE